MPKVSSYPAVTVPADADELYIIQGGVSKKITLSTLKSSYIGDLEADTENFNESIFYPAITGDIVDTQSAQTLTTKTLTSPVISNSTASKVAMYDGSKALGSGTNTDAELADAVSKKHTQNTDTGTTATSFKINTGGHEADLQTTGLSADRDYTLPDIDTMLAGSVLTTKTSFEIIAYP